MKRVQLQRSIRPNRKRRFDDDDEVATTRTNRLRRRKRFTYHHVQPEWTNDPAEPEMVYDKRTGKHVPRVEWELGWRRSLMYCLLMELKRGRGITYLHANLLANALLDQEPT